jgi:NADPH:quinone reductase-like Zn-dependent oxidoreductase
VIVGVSERNALDLVFFRELINKKHILPVISRGYKLDQMAQAQRYAEEGLKKGNVVITVEHITYRRKSENVNTNC